MDCSINDSKTRDIIEIITGAKSGITPWNFHSDNSNNILNNIGKPQLDLVNLYQYENNNKNPISYYLIPGAGDNVICDSLAQEIGCTQCINTDTFRQGTSLNVALRLLYERPDDRVNDFSSDPSLNEITSVKSAGWGLTQCSTIPTDKPNLKVYTHEVNLNPPNNPNGKYGYENDISNNRYAYWLKSSSTEIINL